LATVKNCGKKRRNGQHCYRGCSHQKKKRRRGGGGRGGKSEEHAKGVMQLRGRVGRTSRKRKTKKEPARKVRHLKNTHLGAGTNKKKVKTVRKEEQRLKNGASL